MPHALAEPKIPLRVAILGWLGSRERHLRPLGSFYEGLGADVHLFVADGRRALLHHDGYPREASGLVDSLVRAHEADPRPLVLHSFSNHGFWTALSALEEIRARDARLFAAFSRIVIDSAPGIPERTSLGFTMRFMPRAMMPGLLSALGLEPRLEHPLFTPLVASLTALAHLAFPGRFRAMAETLGRMRRVLRDKHALFIWGDADELVPHAFVETFAAACEAEGVLVERRFFPGSTHVRHFVTHRAAYLEATSRFVASIGKADRRRP